VIFLAGLTILKKVRCLGRLSGCRGWSCVCTPPLECCRLPPTYFWATWHQTRAFLISVNNKKWFFWLVWQFWKRRGVCPGWVDVGVDPVVALHLWNAADYRLPTFGAHGTKLGHSWYHWTIKSDLSGWFDNLKKGDVFGHCEWIWGDPAVVLPQRNAAEYRLPTFGPHGTKLGHSWYQWIIKLMFLAGLTVLKKERFLGRLSGWEVDPVVALHLRNAADYRLPTFGPHDTKLGHSWFQWLTKSDLSGWFDNFE